MTDRARVLYGIKKCLSDAYAYFQETMDVLDEIGRGSLGAGMTPLVGGYAMGDPDKNFREAIRKLDRAEKALRPLAIRFRDGRVNRSHFIDDRALVLLKDITEFDYQILFVMLAERRGRDSVWYRLREISEKVKEVFGLVASE